MTNFFKKIFKNHSKVTQSSNFEKICYQGIDECIVTDIKIENGSFVFANDSVILLKCEYLMPDVIRKVKIPFDGLVIQNLSSVGQKVKNGTPLFEIQKSDTIDNFSDLAFEYSKRRLHDTLISLLKDDFTNEKSLSFNRVAGQQTEYFKLYLENESFDFQFLGISFVNTSGFVYLELNSRISDFSLGKDDTIIFLFEDGMKIEHTFKTKTIGQKNNHRNAIPISSNELNYFALKNLIKIKLTSEKRGLYGVFHLGLIFPDSQYKSVREGQYLLKFMTASFIKEHINHNIPLPNNTTSTS